MKVPPMIRDLEQVEQEAQLLESLQQITIAINVRNTGDAHIHPTTKAYSNLNAEISIMSGADFNFVETLLSDGHGKTHTSYTLKLETLYKAEL